MEVIFLMKLNKVGYNHHFNSYTSLRFHGQFFTIFTMNKAERNVWSCPKETAFTINPILFLTTGNMF